MKERHLHLLIEPHPKTVIAEPLLYTRQRSGLTSLNSEMSSEMGSIIVPTFRMRKLKRIDEKTGLCSSC